MLQESIKDLKNSRNCNNFSQNYESEYIHFRFYLSFNELIFYSDTDNTAKDTRYLKDYKFNVFKKKTKEPLNEKNSNNEQAKSAKCEKKGLKNTNSKNDFESLNSEQLQMLTHTLLNSLIEVISFELLFPLNNQFMRNIYNHIFKIYNIILRSISKKSIQIWFIQMGLYLLMKL